MDAIEEAQGDRSHWLWHNMPALAVLVALVLGLTIGLPGAGVLGAFAIAIFASLVALKSGSFRDLGFSLPESWGRMLGTTLVYGAALQMTFVLVIDPGLGHLTGKPVDLSAFEGVRGNFVPFLILMAIGWGVGGFLEEITFRGFVVGRLSWMFGSGKAVTWAAVAVAAVAFGIAHTYQGISGVISTGLAGFVFGAIYVGYRGNIWYPIFTHGFTNTFGITFIYLDADRYLNELLF
jgi:membrane protease YdiL (CAAX protease family)